VALSKGWTWREHLACMNAFTKSTTKNEAGIRQRCSREGSGDEKLPVFGRLMGSVLASLVAYA